MDWLITGILAALGIGVAVAVSAELWERAVTAVNRWLAERGLHRPRRAWVWFSGKFTNLRRYVRTFVIPPGQTQPEVVDEQVVSEDQLPDEVRRRYQESNFDITAQVNAH